MTATVFADLIVVPSELRFSDRAKSGPVDRYLAVRSRSGVPFDIVGVEWDGNEPLWDKASFLDGWRIHLTDIEADACKGPLVILTNHPDESRLAIPVRTVPVTLEQKGLH